MDTWCEYMMNQFSPSCSRLFIFSSLTGSYSVQPNEEPEAEEADIEEEEDGDLNISPGEESEDEDDKVIDFSSVVISVNWEREKEGLRITSHNVWVQVWCNKKQIS